jgi:hypothetical protein
MLFTIEVYKQDKRVKAGKRLVTTYDLDRSGRNAVDIVDPGALFPTYKAADGYEFVVVETMVTRRNVITGQEYQERYDTPYCCSPSSEAYWSM